MRGGRHLKPKHRHQRQGPPPGWAMDPADELALVQSGHTPPMGFPAVAPAPAWNRPYPAPVPVQRRMDPAVKWLIAAGAALACMVMGAIIILTLAFIAGAPQPATATETTQRPPIRQTVVVNGDQIKVKARELCPEEDACDIDYEGRGTWTITRRVP